MKLYPLYFAILSATLLSADNILLADEDNHWSYSGETGPEYWAELSPEFAACGNGVNQSPIDITNTVAAELATLQFNYESSSTVIVNNGHTLQINAGPNSWLYAGGEYFQLLQLHFHSPSEHQVNGEIFPLEGHFVHQNNKGALAVVAVLFRAGEWNTDLARFGAAAPKDLHRPKPIDLEFADLELFRDHESYYRYNGSLTTPPCTEGLRWYVLKNPGHIAPEQAAQFVTLIGKAARGPQPINARIVLEK
jgi:carbonic anhydrase